jgi:hypothetical protein
MLKFLVQTFCQPLFSHSPLAIFFLQQLFSLPKASHSKKPKPKAKSQKQKQKAKSKKQKAQAKSPSSSFRGSFINLGKHGGAVALGEGCDIVTGKCIPASLNTNNLAETVVLLPELC